MRTASNRNADLAPDRVDHLPGLELRNINPCIGQNLAGLRTGNANRAQLVADVLDLDVIHDDVALQQRGDLGRLLAIGRRQQIITAVVGNQIALIVSLRSQDEAVNSMVRRQIADVVGDHAIQPAHAISAAEDQLGLPAHVEHGAALKQGLELGRHIAEAGWRLGAAIVSQARSRGRQLIL